MQIYFVRKFWPFNLNLSLLLFILKHRPILLILLAHFVELFFDLLVFLLLSSLFDLGLNHSGRVYVVLSRNFKLPFLILKFFELLLNILLFFLFCNVFELSFKHRTWNDVVFFLNLTFHFLVLIAGNFVALSGFFKIFKFCR
jgi:hypothetical protein